MEKGKEGAAQNGKKDCRIELCRSISDPFIHHEYGNKGTDKSPHSLKAFQSEVRDAALLTIDSANRHNEER